MSGLLFDPSTLDSKALTKLKNLEGILTRWSKNLNLVSEGDISHIWDRHIVDSLQLIPFMKNVNKMADMGSGVGLPTLPLAIACPDVDFFAIETQQKKTALMSELVRELRLANVHVLNDKIEKVFLSHMDSICCRAFGEFARDAKLAYRILKPNGNFITFKAEEMNKLPENYSKIRNFPYQLPKSSKRFYIVVAEKAGES